MIRRLSTAGVVMMVLAGLAGCGGTPGSSILGGPHIAARDTGRGLVLTLGPVLFDHDQDVLRPEGRDEIARMAGLLRQKPHEVMLIEGHADDRGTDAYNLALSERRAAAVRQALIANGIEPRRLVVAGMGETMPAAYNDSEAGRQRNRRAEVVFR